jgi:hypothetical protein
MTNRTPFPRSFRAVTFILAVALLAAVALPALAAVTLTAFRATPQADNTILVYWASATELDTASYQLFRSQIASPGDWGAPIDQQAAQGSLSPAEYRYVDQAVTPGETYYYRLVDISVSGMLTDHGTQSARILLPGETATNTPTATSTFTTVPTATTGAGSGFAPTATATQPPPTATRQFTNTPVVSPIGTPVLSAPTAPVIVGRASPTPLPGASLATPTGQPQLATAAPAGQLPTTAPIMPPPGDTPTVAVLAQASGSGLETATSVPTREVTPIIFASETRTAADTASDQAVASQGSRNMGPALAVGGGLLGLAGIAAAALLFIRSRKA